MIEDSIEEILKKVKLLELENEILKSQNESLSKTLRDIDEALKELKGWII